MRKTKYFTLEEKRLAKNQSNQRSYYKRKEMNSEKQKELEMEEKKMKLDHEEIQKSLDEQRKELEMREKSINEKEDIVSEKEKNVNEKEKVLNSKKEVLEYWDGVLSSKLEEILCLKEKNEVTEEKIEESQNQIDVKLKELEKKEREIRGMLFENTLLRKLHQELRKQEERTKILRLDSIIDSGKKLTFWTGLRSKEHFVQEFRSIQATLETISWNKGSLKVSRKGRKKDSTNEEKFFWFLVRLRRGIFF